MKQYAEELAQVSFLAIVATSTSKSETYFPGRGRAPSRRRRRSLNHLPLSLLLSHRNFPSRSHVMNTVSNINHTVSLFSPTQHHVLFCNTAFGFLSWCIWRWSLRFSFRVDGYRNWRGSRRHCSKGLTNRLGMNWCMYTVHDVKSWKEDEQRSRDSIKYSYGPVYQ